MSKYDALGEYLREQSFAEIPMTFAEIEGITGHRLPPKAQHHRAWWSNNPSNNVMTKVWLAAGYQTEQVDMAGRKLVFRRTAPAPKTPPSPQSPRGSGGRSGMSDAPRNFEREDTMITGCRHPACGSMKGMFTIAPGTDLAAPMYTDEEWAEIEKEMDADWDEIERGMRGGKT